MSTEAVILLLDETWTHALAAQSVLWSSGELVWLTVPFHGLHELSRYFSLWRPLTFLLSVLPVTVKFSRSCFFKTCPRKTSWQIVFISVCLITAVVVTSRITIKMNWNEKNLNESCSAWRLLYCGSFSFSLLHSVALNMPYCCREHTCNTEVLCN